LVLVAITLGILALANLRKPVQTANTGANGVDVMVVLDVSKSMLSQDAKPSRLDKAKQFINQLLPQLENNRVGLILFAGQAHLQMPLTPDIAAAKMFVSNAATDAVSLQGTLFSEALALTNNALDVKEKKFKTAVLITDGEDNDDQSEEAIRSLNENGVVVHTVGIGSPGGSYIIEPGTNEPKKDAEGNVVVSKLNEKLLQQISSVTKGTYHRLDDVSATAASIAQQINGMEKKGINTAGKLEYYNYFPLLLAILVVLLLLEPFIPERKISVI